jgi:pimeloyl-ACP methyl ester carboxylesterase
LLAVACASAQDTPATSQPAEIVVREALVIGQVAEGGRSAIRTDAVQANLVRGRWSPPEPGQTLQLPDGAVRTWKAAVANEEGWFEDPALGGGYAYVAVESDHWHTMMLQARGHSLVYVNGEPRMGDPYDYGIARLPVVIRKGRNDLLFVCGRGRLWARLTELAEPTGVTFDLHDNTLPDLIVGQLTDTWAAVLVVNSRGQHFEGGEITVRCGDSVQTTPITFMPPFSVRKSPFRIAGPTPSDAGEQEVELVLSRFGQELDRARLTLRVRQPDETYRSTFVSNIDGSTQFYAVQPAAPEEGDESRPGLVLTLHGAGVDALHQASCYSRKSWAHVVAPTNRRPFGFDWEDWGRADALEALEHAQAALGTDPRRTWLTGHSMGGHGVWHLGVTFPDLFAAIAPCSSWISFWSYANAPKLDQEDPFQALLMRAASPSDTLALLSNLSRTGIYILHGEKDDNVPVEQSRRMNALLGGFHEDYVYHEQPEAGHWWGNQCMDWPPLFDFLKTHSLPAAHEVRQIDFVTANPGVSSRCYWAVIDQQQQSLKPSRISLTLDPEARLIKGSTENVASLMVDLKLPATTPGGVAHYLFPPGEPYTIELDGQRLEDVGWPVRGDRLHLLRRRDGWRALIASSRAAWLLHKEPDRSGPFKQAFYNRMVLVYATGGTPEEVAWAQAKARYDAEQFWYRGNGAPETMRDTDFDPTIDTERNVILYGNAVTNRAWKAVLDDCPLRVEPGAVRVGERSLAGDDLALVAVFPRRGSARGLVGVVGGSGLVGMRLTERLPHFVSGVAYPDWTVLGPEVLEAGVDGVYGTGFFDNSWSVDWSQSAWRER